MTAFFGLFIFMGVFNCKAQLPHRLNILSHLSKNPVFILVILFIFIVQITLIYHGGHLFRAYGLNIIEFTLMILISLIVIPIDLTRKIYLRKKGKIGGV